MVKLVTYSGTREINGDIIHLSYKHKSEGRVNITG